MAEPDWITWTCWCATGGNNHCVSQLQVFRTRIRAQERRVSRVTAVAVKQRVVVLEENVTSYVHFVVTDTEQDIALKDSRVFIEGVAVLQRHLRATVIFLELQVDHTRDGIGAVSGGSAILQNLNALNRCDGNGS